MIVRNLMNESKGLWKFNAHRSFRSRICDRLGKGAMQIKGRNGYSSASDDGQGVKKKVTMKPLSSRFKEQRNAKSNGKNVNFLTLEHFLLRDKCIKLWRDFIRASRNIPNPIARRETVDWLRDEHFEGAFGLRNEKDVVSGIFFFSRATGRT